MSPTSSFPKAIIIGAMKCGTTSLYNVFKRHRQVAVARLKEPGFFAFDDVYAKGWDWYEGLWRFDPKRHRVAVEASTHYTKTPDLPAAAERMAQHAPEAKLIYLVRDPFERIESQYNFDLFRGRITQADGPLQRHFIDLTRYAYQLAQYEPYYGRDRFLVLDMADLKSDTAATLRRVTDFLGIDPLDADLAFPKHNVTEAKTKLGDWLTTHTRRGVGWVPRKAGKRVRSLFVKPDAPKVRLTEDERRRIRELLWEDLETLRDRYGVDIGRWEIAQEAVAQD